MSSFEHCTVNLKLMSKLPLAEMKADAAELVAKGVEQEAAFEQVVRERLDLAELEEKSILKQVRTAWEAKGGAKKAEPDADFLKAQTRDDLAAKDARANDQKMADKEAADAQRDAFSLTAPEGSVTGEANAMSNTRQQSLDIRASVAPTFYSALQRILPDMGKIADKAGMVKPDQALSWLNSRQKEGRFKAEELQWSGLTDWLGMQKGKVAMADIAAFMRDNGVRVNEVMKGASEKPTWNGDDLVRADGSKIGRLVDEGSTYQFVATDGERFDTGANRMFEAVNAVEARYGETTGEDAKPKYGQYVLPGGENYRELLLTLPTEAPARVSKLRAEIVAIQERGMDEGRDLTPDEVARMQALRTQLEQVAENTQGGAYSSTHWDEKNIVSHVRFNDRTDADGKRVLFIEELQSDWGQQGQKEGFKTIRRDDVPPDFKLIDEAVYARENGIAVPEGETGPWFFRGPGIGSRTYKTREEAIAAAWKEHEQTTGENQPPAAPFVTDTKGWLSLGIKRMIRYAAENGYDKVAFVNGKQSAERYSLEKQIKKVEWHQRPVSAKGSNSVPPTEGTLRAWGLNGDIAIDQRIPVEKVEDYIGKEVAKKLIESPVSHHSGGGSEVRKLEGLDLKVGGEGMKAFYDKIVPQTINDVLKRLGGGKAGTVDLGGADKSRRHDLIRQRRDLAMDDPRRAALDSEIDRLGRMETGHMDAMDKQTGFDITPELREKAMGGLPLFSKQSEASESDAAVADMVKASVPVDQVLGHIAENSAVPALRTLAKAIRKLGLKTTLRFETPLAGQRFTVGSANADSVQGGYRPSDDTALLYREVGAEQTIMHELTHAATLRALQGGGDAALKIRALYKQAKTLPELNGEYGISNEEEFVAEAFTSQAFQDLLAATPVPYSSMTMWKRFKNIVRAILGKPVLSESMLDQVLAAGHDLISENMDGAADGDERANPGRSRAERTIEVDGVRRPITNSKGQLVGQDFKAQQAFWKWFGPSAVVDEHGRPLVVYHGTGADFTQFKPRRARAVWFADDAGYASKYVSSLPGASNNVMPVYLSMRTPLVVDMKGGQDLPAGRKGMLKYANTIEDVVGIAQQQGHDGVIFTNRKKTDEGFSSNEYAVFNPDQIKSATGNAGTFDPNNADIRASVRGQQNLFPRNPDAVWDDPEMSRLDNVIHTLQDKQIDMKRVVQAIRKEASDLEDKWDPYLQEELFHGRSATGFKEFLSTELRPLLTDMQARGVTMAEFEEYLHMRHAQEANEQIAKVNLEMPDGGSGIKTADAQDYLANQSPAKLKAFQALAARVDAITAGTQKMLVDYGLEKQDTINAWNATYKHYVPLQREDMDAGQLGNGTGQGYSVRGSASKRRTGSDRGVVDILANIAMAREKTIVRGEKNRLAMALYGLALKAPNADFWKPVNPQKNPDALRAELTNMGLSPMLVAAIADEPKQTVIDPQTGLVVRRVNPMLRSAPNVVAVRVNGEDRFVFFDQRNPRAMRMALSLKNLTGGELNGFLSTAATVTRAFASINTQYNPIFGIVNLTRDLGEGALNLTATPIAGRQHEVIAEAGRLLGHTVAKGFRLEHLTGADAALWQEFQSEGGNTGFRAMFGNSEDRAKELAKEMRRMRGGALSKVGHAVFDWLSDYNESLENVTRMAAYKVAKNHGMTNQQAASLAKNLTVNFNRKGAAGSQIGALYAFFNASVQGTARMAETLSGPGGKKIIAGGLLLGAMQAVMMAAAGFDDDEPPEFIKAKNFIIPLKWVSGKKNFISIPLPLGFAFIPTIGRLGTEFGLRGGKKGMKYLGHFLDQLADTFNPIGNAGLSLQTIAPTAIDPFAALAENKDYTGKPIARQDMSQLKPTPGYTRAKDTASAVSKVMAYYLNTWSGGTKYTQGAISPTPDQIDYLLGQFTGGVGRESLKAQQSVSAMVSGEDLPAHKIPLVGRFYGNSDDKSSVAAKFYDNIKELSEHGAEINGRAKSHEDVKSYMAEHPEAKLSDLAESTERDVQEINRHRRELVEKGVDKARVKEMELRARSLMAKFNAKVDQVRAKAPAN